MSRPIKEEPLPTSVELMRIVTIKEAARLSGICRSTLYEKHRDKFEKRGGRVGMRVRDALMLRESKEATEAAL